MGSTMKHQGKSSEVGKKEKLHVSTLLASMDQKIDQKKKDKPKSKVPRSYTDDIDLPPMNDDDDDDEDYVLEEEHQKPRRETKLFDTSITDKELKKRGQRETLVAQAAELAKEEALKDDHDAFTVTIGSRVSVLDDGDNANANAKDIVIEKLSVSARGKELLKNASLTVAHGKSYGLVGPNGKGKSALMKLLAWRKVPVPKNIDLLLVEQEVVGNDKTALETVVSANEELVKMNMGERC